MHVHRDASLQIDALNAAEVASDSDINHVTQDSLCLLEVLVHDVLISTSTCQSRLPECKCNCLYLCIQHI